MKKKYLWWGLASLSMILALLIAGCTGAKSAQKASPARVKITYWHRMTGAYNTELNALIKKFNASQDKYQVVGTSQGSYNALTQKIMAAAKSKTLPTLSQTPYTNIGDYVKNDFLIPFDDQMLKGKDKLSQKELNNLYPTFLNTGKYQGKYYGLPFSVSTSVLYYNKKLMDQYHISMPQTWEDFATIQKQLAGTDLFALSLDASYDVVLEGMAYGAGSQLITPEHTANLNASKTLAAVNTLLNLRRDGAMRTAGEDFYFSIPFGTSKSVFGIGSSATVPTLIAQAPKSLEWGTTVIPTYEGKRSNPLNGNDNVMFKGATKAQQAGAWAFLKFLMQDKQATEWAIKTGYVPVTKSATQGKTYQAYLKKNPTYRAAVSAVNDSFVSTVFEGYTDYRNNLLSAVDSTITKNVSGEDAFTQLQKQTEAILKANQ